MDCSHIRDAFMHGKVPSDAEVAAHLRGCPRCRELFARDAELGRSLASDVSAAMPFESELFARLEADLARETGLRAWLRSRPTRLRFLVVTASVLCVVGLGGLLRHRADLDAYPTGRLLAFAVLYLFGILIAFGKKLYMSIRHGLVEDYGSLAVGALGMPFLLAFAPATEASQHAGPGGALGCFLYGAFLTLPIAALLWAFDRDDRPSVRSVCLSAVALGLSANLLLELHCPSGNLQHLLLGHASLGVAWLAAWLVVRHASPRRA
jgi:hypothetical protein